MKKIGVALETKHAETLPKKNGNRRVNECMTVRPLPLLDLGKPRIVLVISYAKTILNRGCIGMMGMMGRNLKKKMMEISLGFGSTL